MPVPWNCEQEYTSASEGFSGFLLGWARVFGFRKVISMICKLCCKVLYVCVTTCKCLECLDVLARGFMVYKLAVDVSQAAEPFTHVSCISEPLVAKFGKLGVHDQPHARAGSSSMASARRGCGNAPWVWTRARINPLVRFTFACPSCWCLRPCMRHLQPILADVQAGTFAVQFSFDPSAIFF